MQSMDFGWHQYWLHVGDTCKKCFVESEVLDRLASRAWGLIWGSSLMRLKRFFGVLDGWLVAASDKVLLKQLSKDLAVSSNSCKSLCSDGQGKRLWGVGKMDSVAWLLWTRNGGLTGLMHETRMFHYVQAGMGRDFLTLCCGYCGFGGDW